MSSNKPNVAEKLMKTLKNYSKLIFYVIALLVLVIACFLASEGYRVNKCIQQMDVYRNYLVITSVLSDKKIRNKKFRDFYVASSFRSCNCINQRFDYVNIELLSMNLQCGARFIWLDIFNDKLAPDALPIVSVGKDVGNYTYSLNSIYFEDVVKKIAKIAFNPGYITNYNDPLILALNLNVQKNLNTLNIVKRNIIKHLKNKLLPSRFGYLSKDIGDTAIKHFMGKIILMTSDGYQNSELEEIINASWANPTLRKVSFKKLQEPERNVNVAKLDKSEVKTFNSSNMTIVIPEEESIFTNNYDTKNAFETGCQFIAMNYQKPDTFMDDYITKFRNSSFIERPSGFSGEAYGESLSLSRSSQSGSDTIGTSDNCETCPYEPAAETRSVEVPDPSQGGEDSD